MRKPPRGFKPGVADVAAVGITCGVCGESVKGLWSIAADTETGTDVLFVPCGHSAVPDYR